MPTSRELHISYPLLNLRKHPISQFIYPFACSCRYKYNVYLWISRFSIFHNHRPPARTISWHFSRLPYQILPGIPDSLHFPKPQNPYSLCRTLLIPVLSYLHPNDTCRPYVTPILTLSFSLSARASNVVVLPEPGDDIRFSKNVFCSFNC